MKRFLTLMGSVLFCCASLSLQGCDSGKSTDTTAGEVDFVRGSNAPPTVTFEFRRAETDAAEGLTEATIAGTATTIYLHTAIGLSNADIAKTRVTKDERDRPLVMLRCTPEGKHKLNELTASHVGKPLAILVDGKVVSAPLILSPLSQGDAAIHGEFSEQEAKRIAAGIVGQPTK